MVIEYIEARDELQLNMVLEMEIGAWQRSWRGRRPFGRRRTWEAPPPFSFIVSTLPVWWSHYNGGAAEVYGTMKMVMADD